MKNNPAEDKQTKEKVYEGTPALLSESVTASVWIPDYVLRLRQNIHRCDCPGCGSASPLLQFRWKNHTRHSADISCNRAAEEILCPTAACTLTLEEDAAEHLPELSADRLAMNHYCLRLFDVFRAEPALLLYALRCFIRQAKLLPPQSRAALAEEWLRPASRQRLREELVRLYGAEDYPPMTPQSLQGLSLWLAGARDPRLEKLQKMPQMSEEQLRQSWRSLQNASGLHKQEQQKILGSYLFYELCHSFFPGHPASEWESNFADLCQQALSLSLLLAAVPPEAGRESASALFAASRRATREKNFALRPANAGENAL